MKKRTFWMHGIDEIDPHTSAMRLHDKGVSAVVLNNPRHAAAASAAGLDVWLYATCFALDELLDEDSHKTVDITGRSQAWFGCGCPNSPILRERNLELVRRLAGTPEIKGIFIDRCRFASPAAGLNAFLTCFDDICRQKAENMGYDFAQIRRDVRFLYQSLKGKKQAHERRGLMWFKGPAGVVEWLMDHPGLLDWLRFRRSSITEHFRAVSEIVHRAGLRLGVYLFTPSLAPLVGQSYIDLRDFVDVFAPIIFRNCPHKACEACLAWEITAIPDELSVGGTSMESLVTSIMLSWTRMTGPVTERTIAGLRSGGISPEAAARESILARSLIGRNKELAPIINMDDPLLGETAMLMFANGANGMNFFRFRDNWEKLVAPVLQN